MSTLPNPFGQVLVALVTPFSTDGEVNWADVEKHIDDVITAGADGIVVTGTTGETSTLTDPPLGTSSVRVPVFCPDSHRLIRTDGRTRESTSHRNRPPGPMIAPAIGVPSPSVRASMMSTAMFSFENSIEVRSVVKVCAFSNSSEVDSSSS